MKIFIYSPQREISQIISDHLTEKGNRCIIQYTIEELVSDVSNLKKLPDLLILDYLSYNHDIFNIYENFEKQNLNLPVIFFNDPCLTRSTRTSHWLSQLEMLMCKTIYRDFSIYKPVFQTLEELIESEEMQPYIPLLQKAKPIPEKYIKEQFTLQYLKEQSDDCIHSFCERNKLSANLFYLLDIFQKNRNLFLSYSDIKQIYEEDGKSITEKSLSVLISKLRKFIREDNQSCFLIYQEKNKFKFVRYKA